MFKSGVFSLEAELGASGGGGEGLLLAPKEVFVQAAATQASPTSEIVCVGVCMCMY